MLTDTYVRKFGIAFSVDRFLEKRVKGVEFNEVIRRQQASAMARAEMMIDAEVQGSDWYIRYGPWERYDPREDPERRGTITEFAPIEYRRYLYLHRR